MQKKQQTRHGSEPVNIMATILQSIPKEAAVTKIEYEGPRIALYTNSPKFLLENHTIISKLVGMIKKRIVVRTDQSNLGNDSYGVFAPGLTPQSIRILLSPVLSSIEERPT